MIDPPQTALVKRPCTALATQPRRMMRKVRVYACKGCGYFPRDCVCGTGALSLGHVLGQRRRDRFQERLFQSFFRAFEEWGARRPVRLLPPVDRDD